jgi:hypothetical protein
MRSGKPSRLMAKADDGRAPSNPANVAIASDRGNRRASTLMRQIAVRKSGQLPE